MVGRDGQFLGTDMGGGELSDFIPGEVKTQAIADAHCKHQIPRKGWGADPPGQVMGT